MQLAMNKISQETNNSTMSGSNLMRSHSHSNVNKPSQDLLGLSLHEISDPIDNLKVTIVENNVSQETQNDGVLNVTKEVDGENNIRVSDSATSYNTSKG